MRLLGSKRPIFHSEADFQHALAWELQTSYPSCGVRLEVPATPFTGTAHLDLIATKDGKSIAIELKYKTRDLAAKIGAETFRLKGHSAQDLGRYDFLKDVSRVEQVVAANPGWFGLALFLTNDSGYWKTSAKLNSIDAAFRLHEGRDISGTLAWAPTASPGTIKTREAALAIRGTHAVTWAHYSTVPAAGYSEFRYLLVTIAGQNQAA